MAKKSSKSKNVSTETVAPEVTEVVEVTPVETPAPDVAEVVAEVSAKSPSKVAQSKAIFFAELANRSNGKFATNKAFRRHVRERMVSETGITWASSGSIFNTSKKEAEAEATRNGVTLGLGRDPKAVKEPKVPGRRGRPLCSKNKPKVVEVQVETSTSQPAEESAAQ